jgi:hypothetical protein
MGRLDDELELAIVSGDVEAVRCLSHLDVNCRNKVRFFSVVPFPFIQCFCLFFMRKDGATPLILATENGQMDVAAALLEEGADINAIKKV